MRLISQINISNLFTQTSVKVSNQIKVKVKPRFKAVDYTNQASSY